MQFKKFIAKMKRLTKDHPDIHDSKIIKKIMIKFFNCLNDKEKKRLEYDIELVLNNLTKQTKI